MKASLVVKFRAYAFGKLDKIFFCKSLHNGKQNGDARSMHESENAKEIALTEFKVKELGDLLDETIERTKENVVNKHFLTYDEMEGERDGGEGNAESENDDGDVQIYNPLYLLMGWDRKPRP